MTPTPVSTPLPPPYPGTPTPAEAGPLGVLSPPYVATPGQEDEGNTLPTFQPRTGVPPRAAAPTSEPSLPAIPVPGAPTAAPRPNAFEEPTRLGDPIALARMAVAPPPAVPPAPPPAAMRSTRPAVAPVPPRGDYDDEGATRVAGEPGRGPDEVVPRDTQRSMPPTGGMIHTSPGRAPASGGDYDDEGATRVAGGPAGFAGGGGAPGRGPDDADSPREVPPQRVAGRPSPASSMPPIEPGDATPAPERAGRPGGAPGRDPDDDDDDDGLLAEDTQDRGHKAQSSREAPGSRDARELPPDLQAFSRSDRLLDVDWPKAPAGAIRADDTGDETNPGGGGAGAGATVAGRPPGRRSTVSRVKPVPATSDDLETQPVEKLSDTDVVREPTAAPEPSEALEDGLELAKAFDRSFSEVHDLAPDGSPIERPLPLFSQLSSPALAELKRRMSFRRCAAGDLILREGDPGDACYVIHSGSVRVLKRDPSGSTTDVIEIARLGAGALFGEFAVLADRRRHASVQALEACELYEIPRRLLRELAAEYADVGPALERFFRERLLATLLATAPFFQPLPEEDRAALMARFAPRRIDAGATIIREGERGGGLYLIVLGTVDITRRVDGRRAVLLATLGEGAYFGEMSLLSGGLASATVTAAGPVELAQLTPKDFYDIVALHPPIWEELRREAARRELVNQNILAGETAIV
jgi:CRP-like cAMP-binding protein